MTSYKRPGGPLAGKPVEDYNGVWRNHFGEKIEFDPKDVDYSKRFWLRKSIFLKNENRLQELKEIMMESIASSSKNDFLGVFASSNGPSEEQKEQASAYRVLARQMGFKIGKYTLNEDSYIMIAPIKRVYS